MDSGTAVCTCRTRWLGRLRRGTPWGLVRRAAATLGVLALVGCGGGSGNSGSSAGSTYTVGGTISGLTASGLVLAYGSQTVSPPASATSFTFATAETSGTSYSVTVGTQPSGQTCTVTDGSGTVNAANVTTVQVSCAATTYSGQFLDAPTQGLAYSASPSGLAGTTDANGTFRFQPGDTVTLSLGVGGSNSLSLGSVAPSAPSSGTAELFVLTLANGEQIAQVLQSLNYGSSSAMDVSGLVLPSSDVTALNTYIASGGTVLPASDSTDLQMLAQVQQDATVNGATSTSTTFVDSGGASVSATIAALEQTVSGLSTSSTVTLSSLLPGKVVFSQGLNVGTGGGASSIDYSIDYFNSNGNIAAVSSNPSDPINQDTTTYTTSGNVLTTVNSTETDTLTIPYIDSVQGLWTGSSSNGSTGAGTYVFLQSLMPSMIAGKTLTVTGALSSACGSVPLQLVVDAAGASYTVNCQGSSQQDGSGTIAAVTAIPGIVSFTDSSSGTVHDIGLVAGGSVSSGEIAVIEVNPSSGTTTSGLYGLAAQ